MFIEGVHGNLQSGEIPGAYSYGRLPAMPERPAARSFRDLLVWRKAHEFVLAVYKFTADFPKPETYGLAVQMRRAAVSTSAHIPARVCPPRKTDHAHFMKTAEGSIQEYRH